MSSRKRKTGRKSEPSLRSTPPASAPARTRLIATVVLIAIVAGIVGGATTFLLRRAKPVTIDAGTFTVDPMPKSLPATRPGADDASVYGAYSGSESCKDCH